MTHVTHHESCGCAEARIKELERAHEATLLRYEEFEGHFIIDKEGKLRRRIDELKAQLALSAERANQADKLLGEVELFFSYGSLDDGMDMWRRISEFRTSTRQVCSTCGTTDSPVCSNSYHLKQSAQECDHQWMNKTPGELDPLFKCADCGVFGNVQAAQVDDASS